MEYEYSFEVDSFFKYIPFDEVKCFNSNELEFIGCTTSENISGDIINRHFNEYYIVHKDVSIKDIVLQDEEVADIKWFTKEEVIDKIKNNYDGLTGKFGCWDYLLKYFEMTK